MSVREGRRSISSQLNLLFGGVSLCVFFTNIPHGGKLSVAQFIPHEKE